MAGKDGGGSGDDDVNSAGRAFVFFGPLGSAAGGGGPGAALVAERDADLVLTGDSDFGWFGSRLGLAPDDGAAGNGGRLLLVSSPSHRPGGGEGAAGKLEAFRVARGTAQGTTQTASASVAWCIEGDTWMGNAGLGFSAQVLLCSRPPPLPLFSNKVRQLFFQTNKTKNVSLQR